MKKVILLAVLVFLFTNFTYASETFISPNKSIGAEVTHRDLLVPVSVGASYSFNNGVVFSGSLKLSQYSSIMGEFWQNPELGNRWGFFISPYIDLFKVNVSEQTKTKVQLVPFYGVTISNKEVGMVNFGIKLMFELQ